MLNNAVTADTFPTAATGAAARTRGGNFDVIVTGAAVYMDVGTGGGTAGILWAERPAFLVPGGYGFEVGSDQPIERADVVRFKSAAAGVPGRVTVIG